MTMWIRKIILILSIFSGCLLLTSIAEAGEVILAWDSPAVNTDGTLLTDLGGYRIHYGTSSGIYDYTQDVGSVVAWKVTNLTVGRVFYFAVTAYDISANESTFYNEVSKTIHALPPGNIDTITSPSVNRVDGYDLISFELSVGSTSASANWNPFADIDENGIVDQQDLGILIGNFGAVK